MTLNSPAGSTPTAYSQAISTVQLDDDRVRVTEWLFAPSTQTGWHHHGPDYVVVPTLAGRMTYVNADGEATNELVLGASYARTSGSEHNVINKTDAEFAFVEIELK